MIVLVTGAARGIGRLTVEALLRRDYAVYAGMREAASRNLQPSTDLVKLGAEVVECDVNNERSVNDAFEMIDRKHRRIDVVVNSAYLPVMGPLEEVSDADLHATFETNFFGIMRTTRAAVPIMRRNAFGILIQISSVSGRTTTPLFGPYIATKWALEAASEVLAMELRQFGIRVVIVEPGNVAGAGPVPRFGLREGSEYTRLGDQMSRGRLNDKILDPVPASAVVASIITAIEDPSAPLRIPVGRAAEVFALRERHRDDEWRRLIWERWGIDW